MTPKNEDSKRPAPPPVDRQKNPIALIDTRPQIEGKIIGELISMHPTMAAAFTANEVFQRASGEGKHIITKIVTLKELKKPLRPGELIQPGHLAENTDPEP